MLGEDLCPHYNHLKSKIGYEHYLKSRKNAMDTYASCSGNDLDQASLLVAMLRYIGVEAQYVRGYIYLSEEQALAFTETDNITSAICVLSEAGVPVTKNTYDNNVVKLYMEHVWVRAHVPYTDYRGAGKESGEKVWIDLDTSIKAYENGVIKQENLSYLPLSLQYEVVEEYEKSDILDMVDKAGIVLDF